MSRWPGASSIYKRASTICSTTAGWKACSTCWGMIAASAAPARASSFAAPAGLGRSKASKTKEADVIPLLGAWTMGLILALLALGMFLSFRIFAFSDITPDGSFTLGAVVAAVFLIKGWGPLPATALGLGAGLLAGATTGILHTKFGINGLLSGILVMTALYINGRDGQKQCFLSGNHADQLRRPAARLLGDAGGFRWHLEVDAASFYAAVFGDQHQPSACSLFLSHQPRNGHAPSGDNAQMVRAPGVDTGNRPCRPTGHSMVPFSALFAQYQQNGGRANGHRHGGVGPPVSSWVRLVSAGRVGGNGTILIAALPPPGRGGPAGLAGQQSEAHGPLVFAACLPAQLRWRKS